jgi:hypothetical protein
MPHGLNLFITPRRASFRSLDVRGRLELLEYVILIDELKAHKGEKKNEGIRVLGTLNSAYAYIIFSASIYNLYIRIWHYGPIHHPYKCFRTAIPRDSPKNINLALLFFPYKSPINNLLLGDNGENF